MSRRFSRFTFVNFSSIVSFNVSKCCFSDILSFSVINLDSSLFSSSLCKRTLTSFAINNSSSISRNLFVSRIIC